jgi:uncharacterized protein
MPEISDLLMAMIAYDAGDARRIQHFVKVHSFARLIGLREGLDADTLFILEAAAIVHDIGIKVCEAKYGSCSGKLQEAEGPVIAQEMLERLGCDAAVVERVCYLVGHHHTYTDIVGPDYQILVEADSLVNLYEDGRSRATCEAVLRNI